MIRGLSQEHRSLDSYLEALPQFFVDHFKEDGGNPAFGLVDLHLCMPFGYLDDLHKKAAISASSELNDGSPCLILASSCGPEHRPQTYEQSLPCCHPELGNHSPHLDNLLKQFFNGETMQGGETLIQPHEGIAKIHLSSPNDIGWPKLDSGNFKENRIQNILVFGQELSPGRKFILSAFCNINIQEENADQFVYLAHSIRLGILRFLEDKDSTQTQIQAVDAMLAGHEVFATEQDGRLREMMGALTEANKRLQHSNDELEKFALATSNDLKSPLFAIQNLVYMIEEDMGHILPKEGWELFGKLKQRISQMEDLLQSMLEYSRIGIFEDSPVEEDLNELLKSILKNLLDPSPQTRIFIQNNLPKIHAPKGALLRVFSNLLDNAIRHGGKQDLTIHITHVEENGLHVFSISDDGVGIDSKHHEKVFGLFRTLGSESQLDSSGMGLSMVKKTIEHFGGEISIESEPGTGTTFTFTWPI